MTHPPQPGNLKRVLITRLSAHGDVIQTLPLLGALKAARPDLFVGWLVETDAAPLLENHPLIDALHICPRKDWLQALKSPDRIPTTLAEIGGFVNTLRYENYDASLDVQGLLKSALWPWLANIPNRYGNAGARENASIFYNRKLPPHRFDPDVSAIDRYVEFAEALGLEKTPIHFPLPPVSAGSREKIKKLLPETDLPVIVLAPSTIWPTKHWINDHWRMVIKELTTLNFLRDIMPAQPLLVFIGAPGDQPLIKELTEGFDQKYMVNLAGKTDLVDLYALFERADILIGMDSAPLHIANAVSDNTPTGKPHIIGLFGPTSAKRTGAINTRGEHQHAALSTSLSCQPCFERTCPIKTHACMIELPPAAVLGAIADCYQREARAL